MAADCRADDFDSLGLVLTSRCNLKCTYCCQRDRAHASARWPALQASLEWGLAHGGRRLLVVMTGGEPLLAGDLVYRVLDHLEAAAPPDQQVSCRLMTNGTLLTAASFAELTRRNVEIRLSCDGIAAAQDLRSPGLALVHETLFDRLAQSDAEALHDKVIAAMTVTPANVPHLAAGFAYLLGRGLGRIEMGPVLNPSPDWQQVDHARLAREFRLLVTLSLEHYRRTGEVPLSLLRREDPVWFRPAGTRPTCSAVCTRHPVVDLDGRWYSCGLLAPSTRDPARVPAALSRAACWGRPGSRRFRARVRSGVTPLAAFPAFGKQSGRAGRIGACQDCEYLAECRICPVTNLDQSRCLVPRVPDFVCAFNEMASQARRDFPYLPERP